MLENNSVSAVCFKHLKIQGNYKLTYGIQIVFHKPLLILMISILLAFTAYQCIFFSFLSFLFTFAAVLRVCLVMKMDH